MGAFLYQYQVVVVILALIGSSVLVAPAPAQAQGPEQCDTYTFGSTLPDSWDLYWGETTANGIKPSPDYYGFNASFGKHKHFGEGNFTRIFIYFNKAVSGSVKFNLDGPSFSIEQDWPLNNESLLIIEVGQPETFITTRFYVRANPEYRVTKATYCTESLIDVTPTTFWVTPTPGPTRTPTPTVTPTFTPSPTRTPAPTRTPTATATPRPTLWNTPTRTPTSAASPTPGPTNTPAPTQTATSAASPTPGPTNTPAPTQTATSAATPTQMPTSTPLPTQPAANPTPLPTVRLPGPNDFPVPTSLPPIRFPAVPPPLSPNLPNPPQFSTPAPLNFPPPPLSSTFNITAPAPISMSAAVFTSTAPISMSQISTTFSISYSVPFTLSGSGSLTGTAAYTTISSTVGTAQGWISDTISYTTWLSDEIAALNYTEAFTIESAPADYAPSLPRALADVGWTFETMQSGIDSGQRYSLASWASFSGHIASLPVQLIKSVFELFRFLGAFGLFVGWLLIMLPLVLFFKIFEFLKTLVIRLFNFIFDSIRFILEIIKLLPFV